MRRGVEFWVLLYMVFLLATTHSYGRSKVVITRDHDIQKVLLSKNTKFVIRENIDLCGKKVKIGKGSILVFKGGSISNGILIGDNTKIKAENYEIFKRGYTRYRAWVMPDSKPSAPPSLLKEYHNCLFIEGTWNNKKCGSNWTGLQNKSDEDVMLSIKNFIVLHKPGARIIFPHIEAFGYETTYIPGGHQIDFCNSTLSYPDDLSKWEDSSIMLPAGALPNPLEGLYGLLCLSSNTRISNLSIDGKSYARQDEAIRLGVSCIIAIGNANNVYLENININNVLGPGVTAENNAKDVTFKNCNFFNIGEHIVYSHQYKGYCRFEGCRFDTWDSERLSVFRNGFNYVYKFDPPVKDASYDDIFSFDLSFDNCMFNNPSRRTSQNRMLGGFVTSGFPLKVEVSNCSFTGVLPPFNPSCSESLSEQTGKGCLLIVRSCDGAPYVYPSKGDFNIIAEYYDCKNIPFRTVNTRRYERCELTLDIYEDNIENVSSSFLNEFSEPLTIIDCSFIDLGNGKRINHPVNHRPVIFQRCSFFANSTRETMSYLLSFSTNKKHIVIFDSCLFDIQGYRLVGNNNVGLTIQNSRFKKSLDLPDKAILDNNVVDVL